MLSGEPPGNKKYSIRVKCIILKCVCVWACVHVSESAGIKTCVNVSLHVCCVVKEVEQNLETLRHLTSDFRRLSRSIVINLNALSYKI